MNQLKYILFAILIFGFQNSFACSCVEVSGSFKEKVLYSIESSDYVFIGLVINVERIDDGKNEFSSRYNLYTFEIVKKFKGVSKRKIIKIKSQQDGAACGYNFDLGQTYLVHTNNFEQDNWTGLCTRNNVIRHVRKKELRLLKRYKRKNNS
ncbi:hypothetical protein ULMS_21470 [Patiriisocius marinistellae]|uniref:Tissue inhibitor of metalloproteinase n=1 Tax=Patiriisocius marinistellae TaxID=2494560 RepID=A0A5J4G1R0_9FLAO|nr:hypothetical protein [Patiriisocius marinistellae]GEQ86639.1 hypothetical protein ULMS_21470 [Patiriisocius marinistellae]